MTSDVKVLDTLGRNQDPVIGLGYAGPSSEKKDIEKSKVKDISKVKANITALCKIAKKFNFKSTSYNVTDMLTASVFNENHEKNTTRVDENPLFSIGIGLEEKSGEDSLCNVVLNQFLKVTPKEMRSLLFKSAADLNEKIDNFKKETGSILKSFAQLSHSVIILVTPKKERLFETALPDLVQSEYPVVVVEQENQFYTTTFIETDKILPKKGKVQIELNQNSNRINILLIIEKKNNLQNLHSVFLLVEKLSQSTKQLLILELF